MISPGATGDIFTPFCKALTQNLKSLPRREPISSLSATPKGTLTYPIRCMTQTVPGDLIDVQGDKNTRADKEIWD